MSDPEGRDRGSEPIMWAKMVRCAEFLRDFSDYRDGLMDPATHSRMDAHVAGCSACAGYIRVFDAGVKQLRSVPSVEPSYDFLPRLQHRIYRLEERRAFWRRAMNSAPPLVVAGALVMLLGVMGLWTGDRGGAPLVELPPVVANAPRPADPVHALFRSGPLLAPEYGRGLIQPAAHSLVYRYAPIRAQRVANAETYGSRR
jgi:hypothetical protein